MPRSASDRGPDLLTTKSSQPTPRWRKPDKNPRLPGVRERAKARACQQSEYRISKTHVFRAASPGERPATSFAKSGMARAKARPGRELTKRGSQRGENLALARRNSLKSE